ncbi:MAG: hypothetical protein Kow0059_04840 [Candidatus Sumerlaeia bacterium]
MSSIRILFGLFLLTAKFIVFVLPAYAWREHRRRVSLKRGVADGEPVRATPAEGPAAASAAPVLLLSFVEWTGAWQRPHHLAVGLAGDCPVVYAYWHRVHHWPRNKPIRHVVRAELKRRAVRSAPEGAGGGLSVLSVPAFPLDARVPLFRAANNLLLLHALRCGAAGRRSAGRSLRVIVNAPYFPLVLQSLQPAWLLYDIMDELASDRSSRRAEQRLLQQADRVTTGTWALAQKKGRVRGDVEFVGCGVDFSHFHRATEPATPASRTYEVRRTFDLGRRPVAGFFGAINHRLDAALLQYLANTATDFDFLFIGPRYPSAPRPPALENWKFTGKVDYRDLPDYVRLFDVALIPYHTRGMNQYLHPVKVLEYLAAEKPVVSTPLPDVVEFYADFVQIADSPEAFVRAMREAVREPERLRARVRAGAEYARRHSWRAFVETFRRMLDGRGEQSVRVD